MKKRRGKRGTQEREGRKGIEERVGIPEKSSSLS